MLEDIKALLGITDSAKDAALTIYIRQGVTRVTAYMHDHSDPPIDVAVAYADAVTEYAVLRYRKAGSEGIISQTQGSRSTTYAASTSNLPDSVKELLPSPFIRMR